MSQEFTPFAKIPRWSRDVVITEKIDGTNASIQITRGSEIGACFDPTIIRIVDHPDGGDPFLFRAGSRTRWITPRDDNAGFAQWVYDNADELAALGEGHHFGEWWGCGIQRGYGLDHKRFSLFNVKRWVGAYGGVYSRTLPPDEGRYAPFCCDVIPVLARGTEPSSAGINMALEVLALTGSKAAPGFMRPEGIVIYHTASNSLFKKTIEKDHQPKGKG